MKEEYLLTGPLEPTNEGYAVAKIAGLKMVEKYRTEYGFNGISLMPCNLYGTNDSFDLRSAHVLSSLVRKFVEAVDKGADNVTAWGTGSARREFMHVDDAARAVVFFMNNYESSDFINVGWGEDVTITELTELIAQESGFKGKIVWDTSRPDGMMRKCMDVSRMRQAGFEPQIGLDEGIRRTIREFREISGLRGGKK
jgi:GDP-L-fucose synthase